MRRCSLTSRLQIIAACAAALLVGAGSEPAAASSADEGRDLAQRLCAACHAIGRAERSPIPVAPSFRQIESRVGDLDALIERFQGGVIAGHPEMPAFILKDHEARALVAYMRSLRDN
jgi:mono/diheme cytochrome c family protein